MTITELRAERNSRLAHSDFAMLPDLYGAMCEGDRLILCLYRQALRDLPAAYEGEDVIAEVEWPDIPPVLN